MIAMLTGPDFCCVIDCGGLVFWCFYLKHRSQEKWLFWDFYRDCPKLSPYHPESKQFHSFLQIMKKDYPEFYIHVSHSRKQSCKIVLLFANTPHLPFLDTLLKKHKHFLRLHDKDHNLLSKVLVSKWHLHISLQLANTSFDLIWKLMQDS